jgi:hypothetical protein
MKVLAYRKTGPGGTSFFDDHHHHGPHNYPRPSSRALRHHGTGLPPAPPEGGTPQQHKGPPAPDTTRQQGKGVVQRFCARQPCRPKPDVAPGTGGQHSKRGRAPAGRKARKNAVKALSKRRSRRSAAPRTER